MVRIIFKTNPKKPSKLNSPNYVQNYIPKMKLYQNWNITGEYFLKEHVFGLALTKTLSQAHTSKQKLPFFSEVNKENDKKRPINL
jgi:hypothetical protein